MFQLLFLYPVYFYLPLSRLAHHYLGNKSNQRFMINLQLSCDMPVGLTFEIARNYFGIFHSNGQFSRFDRYLVCMVNIKISGPFSTAICRIMDHFLIAISNLTPWKERPILPCHNICENRYIFATVSSHADVFSFWYHLIRSPSKKYGVRWDRRWLPNV